MTLKTSSLGFEVAFCVAMDAGSNHDALSYKTEIQVTEREDVEDGGNG
jgi:hypothetical protein